MLHPIEIENKNCPALLCARVRNYGENAGLERKKKGGAQGRSRDPYTVSSSNNVNNIETKTKGRQRLLIMLGDEHHPLHDDELGAHYWKSLEEGSQYQVKSTK